MCRILKRDTLDEKYFYFRYIFVYFGLVIHHNNSLIFFYTFFDIFIFPMTPTELITNENKIK